jgi:hypothetical protein
MFEPAFDACLAPDAGRVARLIAALPPPLASLLRAELDAGNHVMAIDSGFPAPPAGVLVRLAQAVASVDAADAAACAGHGLVHRRWPAAARTSGWSDARGHCWLLEPAVADGVGETPVAGSMAMRSADQADVPPALAGRSTLTPDEVFRREAAGRLGPSEALRAWDQSRHLDYERWREGIGYDLDALRRMTPTERESVELGLVHGIDGWREVQALAAIDTRRARDALARVLRDGRPSLRMAVLRHAPKVAAAAGEVVVTEALIDAIALGEFFDGLSEALSEVLHFHPPDVIEALWRALAERPGRIAAHVAARLACLHGLTEEPFDWALRPFFLSFNTEDPIARRAAIGELRQRIAAAPPRSTRASPCTSQESLP